MMKNCDEQTHDRGAFATLAFERCAKGFTLTATSFHMGTRVTFAFDGIEPLADWLVEQYGDPA